MLLTTVLNFLSALALAALIGAERELAGKKENDKADIARRLKQFGGIRTHMLIGLLGALGMFLTQEFDNQIVFIGMAAAVFLLLLTHYIHKAFILKSVGLTTTVTGLITFFVGALCVAEYGQIAVMLSIVTTVILLSKKYTRSLLDHIEHKELTNTLKFAAILFVILPLLPSTAIDPWGLVVPQKVWQVVILISGISYVGYILSKVFGQRKGIILSGVLGGIASSTAVTSSMAEQSKHDKGSSSPYVIATVIASSMMFFRVLFWVFSFNQELTWKLMIPILAMGISSAIVVGILFLISHRKNSEKKNSISETTEEVALESPFQVVPALKFAVFFLCITILSEVATRYLGEGGTYLVSFISGFADVDAITVTLSNQALMGQIASDVAAKGIIIAMIMNTIVKLALAKIFGGRRFGNMVVGAFSIILLTGGISVLFV